MSNNNYVAGMIYQTGAKRSKKGGKPHWVWGFLSGGKKRTRKMGKKI